MEKGDEAQAIARGTGFGGNRNGERGYKKVIIIFIYPMQHWVPQLVGITFRTNASPRLF